MNKKITYYLGAGASANAIPVVADMKYRMEDVVEFLKSIASPKGTENRILHVPEFKEEHKEALDIMIEELSWLIKETQDHQSVDNLAKKFYVQESEDLLNKLKRSLTVYFSLIQGLEVPSKDGAKLAYNRIEKRLDNLIACLIDRTDSGLKLNEQVNIIRWNYDIQPELILKNYYQSDIHYVKEKCQIFPNRQLVNKKSFSDIDYEEHKFALVKLNGNALMDRHFDNGNSNFENNLFKESNTHEFIRDLLQEFKESGRGKNLGTRSLNFAWEEYDTGKDRSFDYNIILGIAERIAVKTTNLIIIGYSFPFFNSKIDKQILTNMKSVNSIIIQDENFEEIRDRLLDLVEEWRLLYRNNQDFIRRAKVGNYYYIDPNM